jgi:flagellar biosynthesis protein FlhA
VLATHFTEVVKAHAAELLTREEVMSLVVQLKDKAPKLVDEVLGDKLAGGSVKPVELQRVLQNLLRERVAIRDLEAILETLAEWSAKTKDLDVLTEYVRNSLRRSICQQYAVPAASRPAGGGHSDGGRQSGLRIVCVTLDPSLEQVIASHIDRGGGSTLVNMDARTASLISGQIITALRQVTAQGHQPVVIASPQVRAVVRQLLEPHLPAAAVLGYNEIVPSVEVESLALVAPPKDLTHAMAA